MSNKKRSFEYYFIAILFAILIICCFLQVLFRLVLNLPLAWTEELSRYVFIVLIYLGASAAAKERKHVRIEVIDNLLSPHMSRIISIIVQFLCAISCFVISINIKDLFLNSYRAHQFSAALRLPMAIMYFLVGLMFLIIGARFFQSGYLIFKDKNNGGSK